MNNKVRIIVMGLFASAVISFAGVSCMQYLSSQDSVYIDTENLELVQTEPPEDGDPIAIIKTSLGDIKAVLYPEYAPNAVENFTELAQSGYYDNTYVFQSEPGVYFGAGSPNKNGELGDDYNEENETVVQELNQNLWPFRGALCSIKTGVDGGFFKQVFGNANTLNGSRFAVLNSIEITDDIQEELIESNEAIAQVFIDQGGVPNLSQQITIFGQTYEGFDVIDALTSLEVDVDSEDSDIKVPKDDIMIETIEIGTYSSEESSSEESATEG
jgi:peptidyl-prolyl cis-trans isomerase B (cyclophilin B)